METTGTKDYVVGPDDKRLIFIKLIRLFVQCSDLKSELDAFFARWPERIPNNRFNDLIELMEITIGYATSLSIKVDVINYPLFMDIRDHLDRLSFLMYSIKDDILSSSEKGDDHSILIKSLLDVKAIKEEISAIMRKNYGPYFECFIDTLREEIGKLK